MKSLWEPRTMQACGTMELIEHDMPDNFRGRVKVNVSSADEQDMDISFWDKGIDLVNTPLDKMIHG